jgi:hypothetical protein
MLRASCSSRRSRWATSGRCRWEAAAHSRNGSSLATSTAIRPRPQGSWVVLQGGGASARWPRATGAQQPAAGRDQAAKPIAKAACGTASIGASRRTSRATAGCPKPAAASRPPGRRPAAPRRRRSTGSGPARGPAGAPSAGRARPQAAAADSAAPSACSIGSATAASSSSSRPHVHAGDRMPMARPARAPSALDPRCCQVPARMRRKCPMSSISAGCTLCGIG